MVIFKWSPEKNSALKADLARGICFEDVVAAIESGSLLDDLEHVNGAKYPRQRVFVVHFNGYVYAVPYVREGETVFLKTAFPSRKLNGIYLKELKDET